MPVDTGKILPGVQGKDFTFVSYGSRTYVVYRVKLPNGKYISMSWRVSDADMKGFGVDPGKVKKINQATFHQLQFFGNATEIVGGPEMANKHPFQVYLKKLQDVNGHVSWMKDKEFVATMLMGWAEGWSGTELQQKLSTTKWYQSRTAAQRNWQLNMSKQDRAASIDAMSSRIDEYLRELYGADFDLTKVISKEEKAAWAKKIASGTFGSAEDGFAIWQQKARDKAEKEAGTPAWIAKEQEVEGQRAFLNRPADMYARIRDQAFEYLGPMGMPDDGTLKGWAVKLVNEKASDADFQDFLETKAKQLYPYLGQGESWQSRASSYKRRVEGELGGMPIRWDDPLLQKIADPEKGTALAMSDYDRLIRSDSRFWQGPVAAQEGYRLFDLLNSTFNGVG